jgi:hypothetical protein
MDGAWRNCFSPLGHSAERPKEEKLFLVCTSPRKPRGQPSGPLAFLRGGELNISAKAQTTNFVGPNRLHTRVPNILPYAVVAVAQWRCLKSISTARVHLLFLGI